MHIAPDGSTERDHLVAYAKSSGQIPNELVMPALEPGSDVLWTSFLQLHNSRGAGGNAISHSEIVSWQTLTGVDLNPWELDVIQALDRVARTAAAQQPAKTK